MPIARVFRNGDSQAVRLPKELRIEGDRVYVKKEGNAIVLLPCGKSWQPMLDSLGKVSPDFMEERNQPSQQAREGLDEVLP